MKILIKTGLILLCQFYLLGCKSSQIGGSFYSTSWSVTAGNSAQEINKTNFISYHNYLIEFKNTVKFDRKISPIFDSTSYKIDTSGGLYIIINNKYFEFEHFTKDISLANSGDIENKPSGIHIPKFDTSRKKNFINKSFSFGIPKDTVINSIPCLSVDLNEIGKAKNDSIRNQYLLYKDKNLISWYKVAGIHFTDANYCVIGVIEKNLKNGEIFKEELKEMRKLNSKELEICKSLIKKIKLLMIK